MPSPISGLCLGLVLGAAATWLTLRPCASADSSADSAIPPRSTPVSLPAWSWRDSPAPPLLPRIAAASAISAWLAQPTSDYAARAAGLRALLLRLPAESFPPLAETLSRSVSDDDRRLLDTALTAWVALDAPAAARWAAAGGEKQTALAREALARWITDAPLAAAEWVCSLADPQLARTLATPALARLAEENPDRALALARSRDPEFQQFALRAILHTLGQKDPAGTLHRFAPDLWKNGSGFPHVNALLVTWANQNPSAAISWLLAQPRAHDRELAHWLSQISSRSTIGRQTFANALATLPGEPNRASLLSHILSQWSMDQPGEALAWVNSLSDPELRLNVLERANHSHIANAPQKSLPLALALPEGANRARRLSNLLAAWAKIDSTATLAWLRENASEPGVSTASHAVHASLLADLAREDPQAALAEYTALANPASREAAVTSIARAWGEKDPAAALRWAAEQRDVSATRHLYNSPDLIYRWARTEPEVALRWLEAQIDRMPDYARLGSGLLFDSLGGTWQEKAPRAATADLYTKIKDPALRTEVLTRHVREWLTKDPAAARAWLESNSALTPEQAAALLAPATP